MKCVICEGENWENVDKYRHKQFYDAAKTKPVGMSVCLDCGFVSYPEKFKTEEDVKSFYKNQYRSKAPQATNYFSSERKLGFHQVMLKSVIEEWVEKGIKPVFADVGCGIGLVPHWMKLIFSEGDIYGTEYSKSYRRVAWHSFEVETQEEIKDVKHDLIMLYQVAEHQYKVDEKLKHYASLLKDDGYFYVSVPVWFNNMTAFGVGGWDLEYYYDEAHINVWTEPHFEYLLYKSGFEIVKKDTMMYGNTYLCRLYKAPQEVKREAWQIPTPDQIKDKLDRIKRASVAFDLREYGKALELYSAFPMAWRGEFESQRQLLTKGGFEQVEEFWKKALECTGGDLDLGEEWAGILMRFDKFDRAAEVYSNIRQLRPRHPFTFLGEGQCYRELAKREEEESKRIEYLQKAKALAEQLRNVSSQSIADALNWSYADASQLPTPQEGL